MIFIPSHMLFIVIPHSFPIIRNLWPVLAIIAFNVAFYWETIWFATAMDDTQHYEQLAKTGFVENRTPFSFIASRLYGAGTFGINTMIDHIFTMTLWTLLCVLAYYAFGQDMISFVTAILIGCHPVNNQISIWLNGRRYLICAILLMAFIFVENMWGCVYALPLYLASGMFQVTIFFAPLLFLWKDPWLTLAIAILLLIMRKHILIKIKTRAQDIFAVDMKEWKPRRPVIVVKLYGFYFFKMIIPGRVQTVYPFLQMFARTKEGNDVAYSCNGDFAKGCVGLCITAAICFFMPHIYRFYVLFFFLSLLQWCAIIPITQLVADRYAAIPNLFMSFFIAYFSLTFLPAVWAAVVLCLLAGGYMVFTRQVFYMYRNFTCWYDYHVYDDFSNLSVLILKIGLLMGQRRLCQAGALMENALQYYPKDYALNYLGYIMSMITQNIPAARNHLTICQNNIYLGEDKIRAGELSDADIGIRCMQGEKGMNIPAHMMMKKP